MTGDAFIESIGERGAIVRRAKSGKLHTVDLRPIAADLSDDDILAISSLRDVRHLELDGAPINDEQLARFDALVNLRHLDLQNTSISDASLEVFRQLPKLQFLLLTGSAVTRSGIDELRRNLINTRIVYL